jgi:hypothetical protein
MRCISKLQNFNARQKVCASLERCLADRVSVKSAYHGVFAAFLILTSGTSSYAAGREPGPPNRSTATSQGSSGRKTVIEVRTSPGVYLPGPTLSIQALSTKPVTPRVTELLKQNIEQTLFRSDPRLRTATTAPDTSIVCTILDLSLSPGVETRTRQEYQRTGYSTVTDPVTGMSRTEDQYSYVTVPYRALVLEGRMSVTCDVTDVATGILLHSDRFDVVYTDARDAGLGPGALSVDDQNSIYLKLADNAAGLILAQLCPRVYSEVVVLPSGKLKEASTLMESGRWAEARILLTTMPAFKNPRDDAYRLYSIGLTDESLAYKSLDPSEKKLHLERAVENYRRAAELKPTEDIFWVPKNRAELVLWQTRSLVAQAEVFEEAKKQRSNPATSANRTDAGNTDLFRQVRSRMQPGMLVIDNQTVVQWVKSGRSSEYITASIKHAAETRFDLSEAEVLKLRRDGVNRDVLKAMEKTQRGYTYGSFGLGKALTVAASILWWLPFVIGR